MSKSGIGNDTTVVLYGDNNNWFAAWAFWQMKIYGHRDVRIMNGGRKKWLAEGRELETAVASIAPASYKASAPDLSIRAFLPEVQDAVKQKSAVLDRRAQPAGVHRRDPFAAGTSRNLPARRPHSRARRASRGAKACNDDGTFKSIDELKQLYGAAGATADKAVIAYCRIGERSSHTWFVLKHLLGYPNVKNYDGSWTEWGNLVGAQVEKP